MADAPKKPAPKWEYDIVEGPRADVTAALTEKSAEGWEPVGFAAGNGYSVLVRRTPPRAPSKPLTPEQREKFRSIGPRRI